MSFASLANPPGGVAAGQSEPIKVMVVDDAVVVRGLVIRWVGDEPDMTLVAAHRSGREAVGDILRKNPDVVILDIEMPDPPLIEDQPWPAVLAYPPLTEATYQEAVLACPPLTEA